jgi:hypothetical protein
MNPLSIIIGFLPQAVFAILANWVPLGWAAAAGLAVAVVVIVLTAASGGVKILPVVQAVILTVFTVVGFTLAPDVAAMVAPYARTAASLALGTFIVGTSFFFPFTVQFARPNVPQEYWHSPQFLAVNRRISLAWGLAVLAVGVAQVAAALVDGGSPILRILLDWVVPVAAAYQAYSVTRRAIAENAHPAQPVVANHPADTGCSVTSA